MNLSLTECPFCGQVYEEMSINEGCPMCSFGRITDGPMTEFQIESKKPKKENIMHYKNGREAKNGDKVLLIPSYGPPMLGILYNATAGNDSCNGNLAVCRPNDPCPNLAECLHIDDVAPIATKDLPVVQS